MDPVKESKSSTPKAKLEKRSNGQGSIYYITDKKGRKVLMAAIYDINGKRRPKRFKKRAEAEDWLSEQKRARLMGNNTYAVNPKMTVSEFMHEWVESQYSDDQSSTRRFYRNAIKNHIIPSLGNIRATNLTTKSVETLLRDMSAKGFGAGTIHSVKASLSAAYNDAVRLGELPRNPVKGVKVTNIQVKSTKPIPQREWEKIYKESMKTPHMQARIEVAGMLGLRPGEALALKWSDLDIEAKSLRIERQVQRIKGQGLEIKAVKQKKERDIPLSDTTVQILLAHKRYQALQKGAWDEDHDLVFPNSVGKLMDEKADRKDFKKLCRAAGVAEYQLYQLRKNAFTNLASLTDMQTLKAFSGHSQISTLMGHYLHSSDETMRSAVGQMDKFRPVDSSDFERLISAAGGVA